MPHTDLSNTPTFRSDLHTGSTQKRINDASRLRNAFSRQRRLPLRAEPTWHDSGTGSPDGTDSGDRALHLRRRLSSGGGGTDGSAFRKACGRGDLDGPNFNLEVPPNGYAWWYVDGISDCGTRALSIIGFIGSVFSPWYAWSGRRSPDNNVCINVATYGPGGRFTMTDRGRQALRQSPDRFTVGPSSMSWTNGQLVIDVNEISGPPVIGRVRGCITVTPSAITQAELALTPDGAHIWRPFAPVSTISCDLEAKGWQWSGHGYFDANFGTRALEQDFAYWTWGRYPTSTGATCFYDATRLDGSELAAGFQFDTQGNATSIPLPPKQAFRRSLWAVRRETRGDTGTTPRQVQNMLDAPFYSRSMVQTQLGGETVVGVHEALDLRRFRSPLLKPMLAVRVPRRPGWTFGI